MKRTSIALLVASLMSAPALAADVNVAGPPPLPESHVVTGHIEAAGGSLHRAAASVPDIWRFEGAARFNIAFGSATNLQLDINAHVNRYDLGISTYAVTPLAHLWYGNGSHAIGLLGGAEFLNSAISSPLYVFGVEGETYFGQATLGGQAAYHFVDGPCCPDGYWNLRAWAKYYVDPNLKVSGEFQALVYDRPGKIDEIFRIWGEVEKRHNTSPMSGFLRGGYSRSPSLADDYIAMAGFRLFADSAAITLREHDQQVPWAFRPAAEFLNFKSDIRLKSDIRYLYSRPDGIGVYSYRYLWSDTTHIGVMAQEVAAVYPDAVQVGADGFMSVNYGMIGQQFVTLH